MDDRETLEYLCWHFGTTGERFWPIQETAESCMESVKENYEQNDEMVYEEGLAWEQGQHTRAVSEAGRVYKQLYSKGYDPVEMAKNEIERSREEGIELEDIDWDWLRFTMLPDEYVSQYVDMEDD